MPFSLLVCFYYHQIQNKFIFYLYIYPLAACRLSAFLISLGCRLIISFLNIPGLQADYQFSNNHCVVGWLSVHVASLGFRLIIRFFGIRGLPADCLFTILDTQADYQFSKYPWYAGWLSVFLISLICRLIISFLNILDIQSDYQFS